jgi:hypothetical protein
MEKAVPEYDCVNGSGYDPVPAWCLAGDEIIEILEKSERVFNGRLLTLTSQVRPRLGFRT